MSVFEKTSNRPQRYLWGYAVFKNVHTPTDFPKLTSLWHALNTVIFLLKQYHRCPTLFSGTSGIRWYQPANVAKGDQKVTKTGV